MTKDSSIKRSKRRGVCEPVLRKTLVETGKPIRKQNLGGKGIWNDHRLRAYVGTKSGIITSVTGNCCSSNTCTVISGNEPHIVGNPVPNGRCGCITNGALKQLTSGSRHRDTDYLLISRQPYVKRGLAQRYNLGSGCSISASLVIGVGNSPHTKLQWILFNTIH
jgi:hypothetical protein